MSNALHTAARHGNTDVIRWLLDPEHLAVYHRSVLWPHLGSIASPWVMKPVDIPIVPPCLCPSRHADAYSAAALDVPHDDGSPWVTALHMALAHNQIDTARLLVERGANWATAPFGTRGVTALMVACANGIVPFLDYLIERASSSSFREARQPLAPRPRDFNGRGYSHYLSAAGGGATTRRLERRLEALETRIYADGSSDPQHKSRRLPADGH
ncbi:hypothetical protein LX36DRAFT_321469 [Colletotrichum falcatum]|nr:hypothetical protein LX36DRAFT_321469 [Colletotrichum falcatum]